MVNQANQRIKDCAATMVSAAANIENLSLGELYRAAELILRVIEINHQKDLLEKVLGKDGADRMMGFK